MTRDEFINWALEHKWRKDRYGHLQKKSRAQNTASNSPESPQDTKYKSP